MVNFKSEFGNFCEQYYSLKAIFKFTNSLGKNSHFSIKIWFYVHLVKTSERHSLAQLLWAGKGSSGQL